MMLLLQLIALLLISSAHGETPDSVSISTGTHTGPMIEGHQYELQCDVHNVAPVQNLTVRWYKGQTLVDQTSFTDNITTPVSKNTKLLINPVRDDDGVLYRCEAELDLGEEGTQPPLIVPSDPLNITVHYTGCPIQIIPQRAVVRYGTTVLVNCTTSVQHNGMGWESTVGGVPNTPEVSLITWRVSNLKDWNIEAPICYINPNIGDQCQLSLPVTVYQTPDSVSISAGTHTGPMIEGHQYELQCDVQNVAPVQNLTVRWYKGQTLVSQTSFDDTIRTPVSKSTKLWIKPVRSDDGVQYSCEAELDLGEEGRQPLKVTSDPLNITVYYVPQITHCQNWSTMTGSSLFLYPNSYSLVGNPHPNISWIHKSSEVNTYVPLTKYDSGEYEIKATNELGDSMCVINITVNYLPDLNCTENYIVKEETLFNACVTDGLPKPDLFLYKGGKTIQLPFQLKWNDSGRYQFVANNTLGRSDSYINISILHGPKIYDSKEKFDVKENDNITLVCNSSGNPEPEMWWSFKNENISTGRRYITLNIDRATSTRAGVYTCSATNEFGRQDKTFTVEIQDSPSYIPAVAAGLVFLFLFIIFLFIIWYKRKKSKGIYVVTQCEMSPLSNGGTK